MRHPEDQLRRVVKQSCQVKTGGRRNRKFRSLIGLCRCGLAANGYEVLRPYRVGNPHSKSCSIRAASMKLPIQSNSACPWSIPFRVGSIFILIALAVSVSGCSSSSPLKKEPRSFTRQLGMPSCRASVPLLPSDALNIGRRWELYPNLEEDPKWTGMIAGMQRGDELRSFHCTSGHAYSYVVIRSGQVIAQYVLPMLD